MRPQPTHRRACFAFLALLFCLENSYVRWDARTDSQDTRSHTTRNAQSLIELPAPLVNLPWRSQPQDVRSACLQARPRVGFGECACEDC